MNQEESIQELFFDIVGQDLAIKFLYSALQKRHIAPAYIFSGPEGIGKKLTAIRFLEGLMKINNPTNFARSRLESRNHPDLLWIEPTYIHQGNLIPQSKAENDNNKFRSSPKIRLDQIKSIKKFLAKKPVETNFGMIIIEGIENINESAANALLKSLEEPGHGKFILITTRPEFLLNTIHSRCQLIKFNRLSNEEITKVFNQISNNLKRDISILHQQKELLRLSNGSPGAILTNIEAWEKIPDELWPKINDLNKNDPLDCLSTAKEIVDNLDYQQQIWIISWLQHSIWLKEPNLKAIKTLEKLRYQIKSFVNPRLAWEIALLEIGQIHC